MSRYTPADAFVKITRQYRYVWAADRTFIIFSALYVSVSFTDGDPQESEAFPCKLMAESSPVSVWSSRTTAWTARADPRSNLIHSLAVETPVLQTFVRKGCCTFSAGRSAFSDEDVIVVAA